MFKWLGNIIGSNDRELGKMEPIVKKINALEPDFQKLTDEELKAKAVEFRERLEKGETLDDLLPEAFAAVRESAKRTIKQRHFDVQLMGGVVLHEGKIAEMKTGEGKTLVATLALYLNALEGEGVHLVTVNDYLAKRDTQWMGPIYKALGLSVGCIQHEASFVFDEAFHSEDSKQKFLRPVTRREAYQADITYGTNNEFGFDYLRDNMVVDLKQCVQRELHYAIVDEVDNILIDEARTPLIISGQAEESADAYVRAAKIVGSMRGVSEADLKQKEKELGEDAARQSVENEYDYVFDEKARTVYPTVRGQRKIASGFVDPGMYGGEPEQEQNWQKESARGKNRHHAETALRAREFFVKDRDYVIEPDESGVPGIVIVDEFTGRRMIGRRYSEGLHQAIEAKENVKIRRESVTLATITFQNYFRMYNKLAGMTGTASTEAEELHKIYKLEVVAIPTNVPMQREDEPDLVFKTEEGKFQAVAQEIADRHANGQPVLVGTVSIEKSERLSDLLRRKGIQHQVLNAKLHEKEAGIVAQAGRPGAVTIATNMAGRGTDIVLGGNPTTNETSPEEWKKEHDRVVEAGGLHIIGTERHEARRIDNQLRGRAGRQGDPGSSRFYVSLEDDVMRRFGGDRIKTVMGWAGLDDDTPIEHGMISKAIEQSQTKVEGYHFDIRKHLVDYDDVVNQHRKVIYEERRKVLAGVELKDTILGMVEARLKELVAEFLSDEHGEEWNLERLLAGVLAIFPHTAALTEEEFSKLSRSQVEERLIEEAHAQYEAKEQQIGAEAMRLLERLVMLKAIDTHWIEHLTNMENLRESIGLEAVGQRDPLVSYKQHAGDEFAQLHDEIRQDVLQMIYHAEIRREEDRPQQPKPMKTNREQTQQKAPVRAAGHTGRNDPCPCGSGKKYKKCCGKAA